MHWAVLLLLLMIVIVYVVIGGAFFMLFEKEAEDEFQKATFKFLQEFYENKTTCLSGKELAQVINVTVAAYKHGFHIKLQNGSEPQIVNKWNLLGSTFFAATIISTIGYGNITPKTHGGKLFGIFYALLGIPLFLVLIAGIGTKLTSMTSKLAVKLEFCRRRPVAGSCLTTVLMVVVGSILFIVLPCIGFSNSESWSYSDSVYFAFVTLLTVGFGDFVPGKKRDEARDPFYVFWTSMWLFVGMAWISTVISTIQEVISLIAAKAEQNKIKSTCSCQEKEKISSISDSCASLDSSLAKH